MTNRRPSSKGGTFEDLERRVLEEMESAAIAALQLTIAMARTSSVAAPRKAPRSNLDHNGMSRTPRTIEGDAAHGKDDGIVMDKDSR